MVDPLYMCVSRSTAPEATTASVSALRLPRGRGRTRQREQSLLSYVQPEARWTAIA